MMLSKVAFLISTLSPIRPAIAFSRSASIPTTVCPSGPMNSSGAYVASAATVSVPFDLNLAGTNAATAEFVPVDAGVDAVDDAPPDELLLLLLPHPATMATQSTAKAAAP